MNDSEQQTGQLKPGDCLEDLLITDLTVQGQGVARFNGRVVFVDQGLPGTRLSALVTRVAKNLVQAKRISETVKSPHEVAPWCPHFGECGACMWQNFAEPAALEWKAEHVRQTLARIGRSPGVPVEPVVASPLRKGYRNKMSYAFAAGADGGLLLGLRRANDHAVVEVDSCGLQHPAAMEILAFVRKEAARLALSAYNNAEGQGKGDPRRSRGYLRFLVARTPDAPEADGSPQILVECISGPAHSAPAGKGLSNAEALLRLGESLCRTFGCSFAHSERKDKADVAQGEKTISLIGKDSFWEKIGRLTLTAPYNAFMQTNTQAAAILYELIEREAGLRESDVLWDIYCGVGGAGLYAARGARQAHGFELQPEAVAAARKNASDLGLNHCFFHAGDVAKTLVMEDIPQPNVIIADPPRAGLSEAVREPLLKSAARRFLYVSCNAATQARDAASLADNWKAVKSLPVDMFPYTPHVENLLVFERRRL